METWFSFHSFSFLCVSLLSLSGDAWLLFSLRLELGLLHWAQRMDSTLSRHWKDQVFAASLHPVLLKVESRHCHSVVFWSDASLCEPVKDIST